MDLTLLALRLFLTAIFAVAAITKLLDRGGSQQAILNFGVPTRLATPLVILLPLFELAVAIALVFSSTAWFGAVGALVLLCAFTAFIAISLLQGRTPECHCFGQLYSRPLGWPTLARNIALAIVAGFLVSRGSRNLGPNIWQWLQKFQADGLSMAMRGIILAAILIVVSAAIYLRRSRSKNNNATGADHQTRSNPNSLPVNSAAPHFNLKSYEGGRDSLQRLLSDQKPVILIFTNPKCGPCASLAQEVGVWQRDYAGAMTIVMLSQGSIRDNFVNTARNSLRNVLLQKDREIAHLYGAAVTPSAILVRPTGEIGSTMAAGADEIRHLIAETLAITPQDSRYLEAAP